MQIKILIPAGADKSSWGGIPEDKFIEFPGRYSTRPCLDALRKRKDFLLKDSFRFRSCIRQPRSTINSSRSGG